VEVFEAAAIYFSSGKNNSLRSDIFFPEEKTHRDLVAPKTSRLRERRANSKIKEP
jgi:hypothetical protein